MATVYNLEPQPTAKVLIHTTSGDILLELFAHQTPLASRNFLQHCLDSYYDNTIFHRLVPGFILQGGDPTGTGHGGESTFDGGAPFADEFHSRLKFNRRGLLGMANSGDRNDNGSQFFLTLGKTEELEGRHTMFGRVVGDTIYNLVKMGEAELTEEEGSERPMYPTRVTGTEVLVNPFEDMTRRAKEVLQEVPREKQPKKKATAGKKKGGKVLLSFGGDEDDVDAPVVVTKANPKLFDAPAPTATAPTLKRPAPDSASVGERPVKRRTSPSPDREPSRSPPPPAVPQKKEQQQPASRSARSPSTSSDDTPLPRIKQSNAALLEQTNAQIAALKSSLQRSVPAASTAPQQKQSALEAMIPTGAIRGRKKRKPNGDGGTASTTAVSRDEQNSLDSFHAFRKRLADAAVAAAPEPSAKAQRSGSDAAEAAAHDADAAADDDSDADETRRKAAGVVGAATNDDEEAHLCDLHFIADCQSCKRWDDQAVDAADADDDDGDSGWMTRGLTFAKDRLGKDLEWKRQNEQELVVIDPREREKGFKEEARQRKRERQGAGAGARREGKVK